LSGDAFWPSVRLSSEKFEVVLLYAPVSRLLVPPMIGVLSATL
jgi:hypothetical protein